VAGEQMGSIRVVRAAWLAAADRTVVSSMETHLLHAKKHIRNDKPHHRSYKAHCTKNWLRKGKQYNRLICQMSRCGSILVG
jgi:hypothetical protein